MIIKSHIKSLQRIEVEFFSGSKSTSYLFIFDINDALPLEITGSIVAEFVWLVAGMGSGMETPSVGLLDIKLRARIPIVLGLLCSAVPTMSLPKRTIFHPGRQQSREQRSDTAAWHITHINIIGHISTEKIRSEVLVWIWRWRLRNPGCVSVNDLDNPIIAFINADVGPCGLMEI